jgi:hypothetical protein
LYAFVDEVILVPGGGEAEHFHGELLAFLGRPREGIRRQILFREIDGGLNMGEKAEKPVNQGLDLLAEATFHLAPGGFERTVGAGPDHLHDAFGLSQVEFAMEKGAAGKFAGFSEAATPLLKVFEQFSDEEGVSVRSQFEDILACKGSFTREAECKEVVEDGAVFIMIGRQDTLAGGEGASGENEGYEARHLRAGDADKGQGSFPGSCRRSDDGIPLHAVRGIEKTGKATPFPFIEAL